MKNKFLMAMGAMAVTIALAAGISYAWFTDQAKTNPTSIDVGYLDISMTGIPDTADNIFPADDGRTVDYTITNSSNREVVVQFKAGALTAYRMPDSYLDGDGYVIKANHQIMQDLSTDQKMNANGATSDFIKTDNTPATDVTSDLSGDWILTGADSEYLGKDTEGNQYFLMSEGGTAKGEFKVGLTAEAGNEYQYALLSLGEATALATQSNPDAIAAAFNGLIITNLIK